MTNSAKTFKNFQVNSNNKEAYQKAKNFISNSRGLFLFGSVGTGKTHLAKATHEEMQRKQGFHYTWHSKFITVPELLLEIRSCFNKKSLTTEQDVLDDYTNDITHLYLDDFGAEKISDFTKETLYLLLCRWEEKEKPKLFITSNLSLKQISESISDRIASRIVGTCITQRLDDKDWRLEK